MQDEDGDVNLGTSMSMGISPPALPHPMAQGALDSHTAHSVPQPPPPPPPELVPRWFRATDAPKRDATPFKFRSLQAQQAAAKPPLLWEPLSVKDSDAVEAIYQRLLRSAPSHSPSPAMSASASASSLAVPPSSGDAADEVPRQPGIHPSVILGGEDNLYQIDVELREISPVFWDGPTYDIRRGTWFAYSGTGNGYQPCDENLARQLEDGYRKFAPWIPVKQPVEPAVPTSLSSSSEEIKSPKPEPRWALFGPYMNRYVLYTNATSGWLQSDELASKLARAVTQNPGTKVIRNWNEVRRLGIKRSSATLRTSRSEQRKPDITAAGDEASSRDPSPIKGSPERPPAPTPLPPEEDEDDGREINHLVLVIHGIGQKLSERVDAFNFPHDCDILRRTIKESAKVFREKATHSNKAADASKVPIGGGIQILPIQWRQKIQFGVHNKEDGSASSESEVVVDDIMPEGIPGIRMLVSDVILDVLLYLTPKYRQEMIRQVSTEMNRVYRKFLEHNPYFNGRISIYGHSLGSLLAYDILTHQHIVKRPEPSESQPAAREMDISDMLVSSMQEGHVSGLLDQVDTIQYVPLDFRVNCLFAVGSPIGLFLLLKGAKIKPYTSQATTVDSKLSCPDVKALYNIFHPSDPVAHRIEPLISKHFASLKPVNIPYTKGGLTETIAGIQDLGTAIVERSNSIFETVRTGLFSGLSTTAGMVNQAGWVMNMVGLASQAAAPAIMASSNPSSATPAPPLPSAITSAASAASAAPATTQQQAALTGMPPAAADKLAKSVKVAEQNTEIFDLNPNGRVDFVVQEGVLENPDCAMFILKELAGVSSSFSRRRGTSGNSGAAGGGGSGGNAGSEAELAGTDPKQIEPGSGSKMK
eukprot:jgi/Hompol1/1534/HPOL_004769-RA